jgi:hypothetical protein
MKNAILTFVTEILVKRRGYGWRAAVGAMRFAYCALQAEERRKQIELEENRRVQLGTMRNLKKTSPTDLFYLSRYSHSRSAK